MVGLLSVVVVVVEPTVGPGAPPTSLVTAPRSVWLPPFLAIAGGCGGGGSGGVGGLLSVVVVVVEEVVVVVDLNSQLQTLLFNVFPDVLQCLSSLSFTADSSPPSSPPSRVIPGGCVGGGCGVSSSLVTVVVVVVDPYSQLQTMLTNVFPDVLQGLSSLKLTANSSAPSVISAILSDPR